MAPKPKPKPKTEKINPGPTETEREFYVLEIADLNRRIARLRTSIDEYEVENLKLQEAYEKLDQDRNDVIVFLKKTLTVKTEEITELKEKVKGLEEIREIETIEYKNQIAELEKNFITMKSQLTSENKLLSGKLNTLEEFRAIRDDLMLKFEKQEQAFKDQEMMYKRMIYDAEKKLIIGKDQLKKDMEKRLLQLAQDYQDATEVRVAASTHRVLRENIAINHELDYILMGQEKLNSMNEKYKEQAKSAQIAKELAENERDTAIRKSVTQLKVIEQLTTSVVAMKKQYAREQKQKHNIKNCERQLESLNSINKELSLKVKILEQRLHNKENAEFDSKTKIEKIVMENRKLKKILRDAGYSLQAIFKQEQFSTDEHPTDQKSTILLLHKLAAILREYELPMRIDSGESVICFDVTYKKGDLGFVPPMEESTKVKRRESKTSRVSERTDKTTAEEEASVISLGSLATVPSTSVIPCVEGEEVPEVESIPSFARSETSSEGEQEEVASDDEDMEDKLAKSKTAIQQSILKDLVAMSRSVDLGGGSQFGSKIGGFGSFVEGEGSRKGSAKLSGDFTRTFSVTDIAFAESTVDAADKSKVDAGAEASKTDASVKASKTDAGSEASKTDAGAEASKTDAGAEASTTEAAPEAPKTEATETEPPTEDTEDQNKKKPDTA